MLVEESQRKDKRKSAKKIIKLAKEHPTWYTKEEVKYAKLIRKKLKKNDTSETSDRDSRSGADDRIHSEGEQPKEPRQPKRRWFTKLLYQARSLVRL